MTLFTKSIDISAPATKVFEALCDFEHYPSWHPGMRKIQGNPELGEWLVLHMASNAEGMEKKKPLRIPVEITILIPDKALEWQGSLFKKGGLRKYFLVRHAFYVEALTEDTCRFTNEEQFYGVLAWPVSRISGSFLKGYEAVNRALKQYCETK